MFENCVGIVAQAMSCQAKLLASGHELAGLEDLTRVSPALLASLAEPWFELDKKQLQILLCVANMHIYARILDNAVDEPGSRNFEALLRAQAFLWQNVWRLATLAPERERETTALINQTTAAVIADDRAPAPQAWGAKNHHLLLAPCLLCRDSAQFAPMARPLSAGLALLQAKDEFLQNAAIKPASWISIAREALEAVDTLENFGFHQFCATITRMGRAILDACEKRVKIEYDNEH